MPTALPLKETITLFQGVTFSKQYTITERSGDAVDLTDSYAIIEFRDVEGESGTILLTKDSTAGAFSNTGEGGVLTLILHDEDTYSLMHSTALTQCFYAIKLMYANTEVDLISYGTANLVRLAAPNAYP